MATNVSESLSETAQQNLGASPQRQPPSGLRDVSVAQPELPDTRSPAGNPPFMRRCLTAALHLYGLTHRELFAYAVLVSHCRAYVDGESGSCRLLYRTWATETGVWKPLRSKTPETPEAAKKRLKSAQREMRTIASRLKEAGLLLVKQRIRAADLVVFPPDQVGVIHPSQQRLVDPCQLGVNHPYLDRGKSPLPIERGSGKVRISTAAAAVVFDDQQQQLRRINRRIEGLIAACAARARTLDKRYDEAVDRQRLAAGEIDVDDLQRLADELQQEIDERQCRRRR